jgi:hypothetical protein
VEKHVDTQKIEQTNVVFERVVLVTFFLSKMPFRITDFQIRDYEGQITCGQIEHLSILVDFIRENGVGWAAKYSFYFEDEENPEEFWNLILRNREDKFYPEFSGGPETWRRDWDMVMNALRYENLDCMLAEHCVPPEFPTQ